MKITIGTKNKAKVAIVSRVLTEYFPKTPLNIESVDIASGVPDTPRGEETKDGAYNRASAGSQDAIYAIGIESGLVERFGMWFEEAWACIRFDEKYYYGYSSGLAIPSYVLRKMNEDGLEHGPTMQRILKDLD
jgi:non-canonical (house-cleaning) NTP pyrophosphatase